MKLSKIIAAIAVLTAVGAGPGVTVSQAVVLKFEGPLISVNRSNRSFLMRDERRGRDVRIHVTRTTRYAGLRGYGSLRKGVEVEVSAGRSPGGRFFARRIELD